MSCCDTRKGDGASAPRRAVFEPAVDIHETSTEWVLTADVPGATREGLDVSFEDGALNVKARVASRQIEGTPLVHREYPIGDFERTFRVGEGVDTGAISAVLDGGVLTIRLPKAESLKPRKIEVQSGRGN